MEQSTEHEIKGSVLPWADSLDRAGASRFTHPDGAIAAQMAIGVGMAAKNRSAARTAVGQIPFVCSAVQRAFYGLVFPRAKMTK